ncbi:IclR family transcriptional regulator [Actinocorallia sp. A-T 12471]|uniref:IclR family transcriptional regulator n=1 Tax=Actinocorallia sp. A-T 12471 TaxID=3089813 RepID=UPI0029D03C65|nr:IclR family transcriptional regulator [Actinocorallia sp. A-T 12471]MDX6742300.1 IclR family transcriptional regulator [Actinocorallia sp. A-T 12471]
MAPERDTSIRRGLDVLAVLESPEALTRGGLGVTRIANILGKDKSQISRSLKVLAEYGLIDRDPKTLAYRLGWRIYSMARRSGDHRLLSSAEPVLDELLARTGESVYLSVMSNYEALTVLERVPRHAVQATSGIWPVFSTSVGRVLLAGRQDAEIRRMYEGVPVQTRGPHGIDGVEDLLARIADVRRDGHAVVSDEFEDGLTAVGAPVRDHRGDVIAALGVSGPSFRFAAKAEEAVAEVLAAAARIEERFVTPHAGAEADE